MAARLIAFLAGGRLQTELWRNASWLMAAQTAAGLLGFLQSIILARALGAATYGTFVLAIAFVTIVYQLLDARIWEPATRYLGGFLTDNKCELASALAKLCYAINVTTSVVALVLTIAVAGFASAALFHNAGIAPVIVLLAVAQLAAAFDATSLAMLRLSNAYAWIAGVSLAHSVVLTALVAWVAIAGKSLVTLAACYIAASVCRGVLTAGAAFMMFERRLGRGWWRQKVAGLRGNLPGFSGFTVSASANGLFKLLQTNADVMLLGALRGPADVGYYKIAKTLAGMAGRITTPLYEAIYPQLTSLWTASKFGAYRALVVHTARFASVLAAITVVLGMLFGPPLLQLLYGSAFLPATPAFRVGLIGAAASLVSFWAHPALLAMNYPWRSSFAFGTSVAVQLLVALLLIPGYGAVGAAIAFAAFYVVWNTMMVSFVVSGYRAAAHLEAPLGAVPQRMFRTLRFW